MRHPHCDPVASPHAGVGEHRSGGSDLRPELVPGERPLHAVFPTKDDCVLAGAGPIGEQVLGEVQRCAGEEAGLGERITGTHVDGARVPDDVTPLPDGTPERTRLVDRPPPEVVRVGRGGCHLAPKPVELGSVDSVPGPATRAVYRRRHSSARSYDVAARPLRADAGSSPRRRSIEGAMSDFQQAQPGWYPTGDGY